MSGGESAEAAGDGSSWFQTASPLAASIRHNKLYVNINLMKNNKKIEKQGGLMGRPAVHD